MGLNTAASFFGISAAGVIGAGAIPLVGAYQLAFVGAGLPILGFVVAELATMRIAAVEASRATAGGLPARSAPRRLNGISPKTAGPSSHGELCTYADDIGAFCFWRLSAIHNKPLEELAADEM
jgi:hypothetical protein